MNETAFFGTVYLFSILLMMLQLGALVWVIYDVFTKQKRMPDVEKILWVVVAFLFTILGALVYYIVVKRSGKYEEKPGEEENPKDTPQVY
ncbi:MAG: PLDc_N domain-containing protein [Thermococcus sp.]|nr:PLDc_N domain-containing protein [Thermococcus sp.]